MSVRRLNYEKDATGIPDEFKYRGTPQNLYNGPSAPGYAVLGVTCIDVDHTTSPSHLSGIATRTFTTATQIGFDTFEYDHAVIPREEHLTRANIHQILFQNVLDRLKSIAPEDKGLFDVGVLFRQSPTHSLGVSFIDGIVRDFEEEEKQQSRMPQERMNAPSFRRLCDDIYSTLGLVSTPEEWKQILTESGIGRAFITNSLWTCIDSFVQKVLIERIGLDRGAASKINVPKYKGMTKYHAINTLGMSAVIKYIYDHPDVAHVVCCCTLIDDQKENTKLFKEGVSLYHLVEGPHGRRVQVELFPRAKLTLTGDALKAIRASDEEILQLAQQSPRPFGVPMYLYDMMGRFQNAPTPESRDGQPVALLGRVFKTTASDYELKDDERLFYLREGTGTAGAKTISVIYRASVDKSPTKTKFYLVRTQGSGGQSSFDWVAEKDIQSLTSDQVVERDLKSLPPDELRRADAQLLVKIKTFLSFSDINTAMLLPADPAEYFSELFKLKDEQVAVSSPAAAPLGPQTLPAGRGGEEPQRPPSGLPLAPQQPQQPASTPSFIPPPQAPMPMLNLAQSESDIRLLWDVFPEGADCKSELGGEGGPILYLSYGKPHTFQDSLSPVTADVFLLNTLITTHSGISHFKSIRLFLEKDPENIDEGLRLTWRSPDGLRGLDRINPQKVVKKLEDLNGDDRREADRRLLQYVKNWLELATIDQSMILRQAELKCNLQRRAQAPLPLPAASSPHSLLPTPTSLRQLSFLTERQVTDHKSNIKPENLEALEAFLKEISLVGNANHKFGFGVRGEEELREYLSKLPSGTSENKPIQILTCGKEWIGGEWKSLAADAINALKKKFPGMTLSADDSPYGCSIISFKLKDILSYKPEPGKQFKQQSYG